MKTRASEKKIMLGSSEENDNPETETSKARKSTSDSVYSTEDSNNSRTDAAGLEEDEFSQLKTKSSKKSKRARCPPNVASESSDDNSLSENRPRKPSDSQYSSDGNVKSPKKRNDLKRKIESEESDDSQVPTTSKGRKKKTNRPASSSEESDASEIPTTSKGRKKKSKRYANLSDESNASEVPTTRKRRQKKAKGSTSLSNESDASEIPIKSKRRKKTAKRSASSSEESDASEIPTKNTRRKRKAKQPSISSDESDASEIPTKSTRRKKKAKRSSSSSDESDASDIPTTSKGRKKERKRCASSSEKSEASRMNTRSMRSKKKVKQPSKADSSDDDDTSQVQSGGSQTEVVTISSSEMEESRQNSQLGAGISQEEESDYLSTSTGSSGWITQTNGSSKMEESDGSSNSQSVKEKVTPKKYKNLRIDADSSDEDEEKNLKPPKKLPPKNLDLLRHIYHELKKIIKYGKLEHIQDLIFGKTCDELVLPEFSDLLWEALVDHREGAKVGLMLVRAGVDVNLEGSGDNSENSLLHFVAEKAAPYKKDAKDFEALAVLMLKRGADINRCNGEGNSVLHSAVKGGSMEIIEELMRLDVELGERFNQILRVAAERTDNAAQILPLLIGYKVSEFDTKEQRAMHALRCFVKNGTDLAAAKVLLDYALPLNELDNEGNTLLHRAIVDSKVEMVKLLLEYGADPRKKRKDDTLPLWHAARQPKSEITGLLIKHGASVHDTNDDIARQYPIHAACNAGLPENIKVLLHFGANLNVTDSLFNCTPFAILNGNGVRLSNDAHQLIIRQLAFLKSKNVEIDERDLKRIREFDLLRRSYAKCLCELEKMKRLIIFEDISVHRILDYGIEKTSHIINNSELIDVYHKNQEKITKEFPIYSAAIRKRMKIAWYRRDRLNTIENAMKEATNNVLPAEIYEKIAYFACYHDLVDFDLKEIPLCD